MALKPDIPSIAKGTRGMRLLEAVRKGTENVQETQWPGTEDPDARFNLTPLLCDELQDAYSATYARWTELGLDMNVYNSDDFFAELAIQVLSRAMRDPDSEDPKACLFADANQLRSNIRAAERDELSKLYQDFVGIVDPDPDTMTEERFDEITDLVKKKDALTLSAISSRMLSAYIIGTAAQSES